MKRTFRVWTAGFPSEKAAESFCEPGYNEDGDAECTMWADLRIDYFDHDFQEVVFGDWKSYLAEVTDVIRGTELDGFTENCAILLYDGSWELPPPATV